VLVLCLKRTKFGSKGSDRVKTFVDFPLDGLDLAPFCADGGPDVTTRTVYDLFAVMYHHGGTENGHCTAIARDWKDMYPVGTDAR